MILTQTYFSIYFCNLVMLQATYLRIVCRLYHQLLRLQTSYCTARSEQYTTLDADVRTRTKRVEIYRRQDLLLADVLQGQPLGVVYEGRPQKWPFSYTPRPQVSAFDQPPTPFADVRIQHHHTAPWSDSVIAGALKYAAHWSHHRGILLLPHAG